MDKQGSRAGTFSLPGIEDETTLRPRYLAELVYDEAKAYLSRYGLKIPDEDLTISWLADRANHLYKQNSSFRLKIQGPDAEQHLNACMRMWLGAKWGKTNPELSSRLPERFTGRTGLLW